MSELTLGSLFDGSGGFPLGGLLAGIKPLWSSEIEPFAICVTERRLPNVKHCGDINGLNGAELPPVDIITFGSPCQDMSLAGRREGLSGSRSNLFFQAIRIIKEMRCATNGRYPRYIVWENVLGAFSSNKGEDFRAVLESVCKVKDESVSVPRPAKWDTAGEIVGDGYSVAWRVLNAQFWGVPQRRRRIFLVGCFDSECAGKILFESDGVSEYSAERFRAWQQAAGGFGLCAATANSAGFCPGQSARARGIGFEDETAPTLRAENISAAVYENHPQDGRYSGPLDAAPTLGAKLGMGGNNAPLVVGIYDVRFTSEGTKNVRHNVYCTETARTLDTGGNSPEMNQGGVAVVSVQGNLIGREPPNGPQGSGFNSDVSFTLNTTDRHAVAYGIDRAAFNQGQNAKFDIAVDAESEPTIVARGANAVAVPAYSACRASFYSRANEEVSGTITASDYKGAPVVNDVEYIVRRLMPCECARLQGFPDWWTDVGDAVPTEEKIERWSGIFQNYNKALGKTVKPKSRKQIERWLRNPQSDSAEYKLWGNGVALPCVYFVLSGIVWYNSNKDL
ncbi:MAG: DNA cytosine methyltransferase [Lachnospiraceae bacterium]|nr:DNA cytosine methyltransferase [Lachnospiraceae bacterium]